MPLTTSAFNLPHHLAPKANPALIAGDEQHFAAIAESLEQSIADLSDRLDAARRAPGRLGQESLERDVEVRRLTARLRALRRSGLEPVVDTVPEPGSYFAAVAARFLALFLSLAVSIGATVHATRCSAGRNAGSI